MVGRVGVAPVAVSARDLSRTGLGFYFAEALPVGAPCGMTLRALDGELVALSGRVARRRHLRGRVYDLGARFDAPIDPGRFVSVEGHEPPPPAPPPESSVPVAAPVTAHDRVAALADAMRRIASEQAPLDELHSMIDELVRLCDSARAAAPDEA